MKVVKYTCLSFVMASMVLMFSCKKNFTCQCHNPATNEYQTFNITHSKKSDAQKNCTEHQNITLYNYDTCRLN